MKHLDGTSQHPSAVTFLRPDIPTSVDFYTEELQEDMHVKTHDGAEGLAGASRKFPLQSNYSPETTTEPWTEA